METTPLTKEARSSMMELCNNAVEQITAIRERVGYDNQSIGVVIDEPDVPTVMACVDAAKKAGQVKGSYMAWYHAKTKAWLVFKKRGEFLDCKLAAGKPSFVAEPIKVNLVPLMVPEHLVAEMRLHLGQLANRKEVEA
jgi:hypothetical protein